MNERESPEGFDSVVSIKCKWYSCIYWNYSIHKMYTSYCWRESCYEREYVYGSLHPWRLALFSTSSFPLFCLNLSWFSSIKKTINNLNIPWFYCFSPLVVPVCATYQIIATIGRPQECLSLLRLKHIIFLCMTVQTETWLWWFTCEFSRLMLRGTHKHKGHVE